MNRIYQVQLGRFTVLTVLSVITFLAGFSSRLVLHVYSEGTYSVSSVIQRFISGIVPFPLGDFLYLILILYIIRSIYLFGKKISLKRLKNGEGIKISLQVLNFILLLYLLFKVLWGLNYSRPSVTKQLAIGNEKYTTAQLVDLGRYFIAQLNALQHVEKIRFSVAELQNEAKAGFQSMEQVNPFFSYPAPVVKPVLNSWIITKIGIEGYYNPLSGEANVNMRLPTVALPFVTCHEIAHQLGIAREDEANLIGYLVASHSKQPYFRYSAAYAMLKSILFEIRIKSPGDYEKLQQTINSTTLRDFKNDREFWRRYNNQMFGYLDVAFDRFLKLNNQAKGTDSYQDIVLWLYNYHKDDLTNK
ncbi:DUF3810 domain-containing protein [Pedobacter sp. GR22-6]|uniref:DUF3810 domain-containing protein n=1 Tax=Pedobacter sp. GR22-6 TaxID=3127957 RepID=UPI00307F455D